MSHETKLEKTIDGKWRPMCSCGWGGLRWESTTGAAWEAKDHVAYANAPTPASEAKS